MTEEHDERPLTELTKLVELLKNFEPAMKNWGQDWRINEEKDVRRILFLLLRASYPDTVDEAPFDKLGHTYSIADFNIPSMKTVVEAKFAGKRTDFKRIEHECQISCSI